MKKKDLQAEEDSIIKEDSMGDDTAPVKKKRKTGPPPKNTVTRSGRTLLLMIYTDRELQHKCAVGCLTRRP